MKKLAFIVFLLLMAMGLTSLAGEDKGADPFAVGMEMPDTFPCRR